MDQVHKNQLKIKEKAQNMKDNIAEIYELAKSQEFNQDISIDEDELGLINDSSEENKNENEISEFK